MRGVWVTVLKQKELYNMRPSYVLLREITSKYEDDDMQKGIRVKALCSENSNSGKAAVL